MQLTLYHSISSYPILSYLTVCVSSPTGWISVGPPHKRRHLLYDSNVRTCSIYYHLKLNLYGCKILLLLAQASARLFPLLSVSFFPFICHSASQYVDVLLYLTSIFCLCVWKRINEKIYIYIQINDVIIDSSLKKRNQMKSVHNKIVNEAPYMMSLPICVTFSDSNVHTKEFWFSSL